MDELNENVDVEEEKKDAGPVPMVRVYRYGLLPPTERAAEVDQQMLLAHRYRNTLIEIERARRVVLRDVAGGSAGIPALEKKLADAQTIELAAAQAIKTSRKETRTRSETEAMRQTLREARVVRSEAGKALREARVVLRQEPDYDRKIAEINERAKEIWKGARALCGVYWGTYLLIEDAMMASKKSPLYDGTDPNDPRFIRWGGEGKVGVQIQKGASVGEIFAGDDTRMRIDPVDLLAWHSPVRGERRRKSRTFLRLRIGSDEHRKPLWAVWPMILHRPFPEGARIKEAVVQKIWCGPRAEWTVDITVEFHPVQRVSVAEGAVAINLGWRKIENDLRVASWVGSDGEKGELRLDAYAIGGLLKPEELTSIRDKSFNEHRIKLAEWLEKPGCEVSPWLKEKSAYLAQWRSPGRLASLVMQWKRFEIVEGRKIYPFRFKGDEEIFTVMEAWRYHDYHLWDWLSNQRSQALRHRREIYRIFASKLSKRYGTLVLETFDLRKVAAKEKVEEAAENQTARKNRQLASVSELRLCLRNLYPTAQEENASYATHECHGCHHVDTFKAEDSLVHQCSACKLVWDQDENAARVLLHRYQKRLLGGATPVSTPEGTESRWTKAKRKSEENKERRTLSKEVETAG